MIPKFAILYNSHYNNHYNRFSGIRDIMISVNMITPKEMQKAIAKQLRRLRLELNLSQQTLSEKSGVSYGSLKKFEQTGQISLASLLKLALVLGSMDDFKMLFAAKSPAQALSLDQLIKEEKRERGRK